MSEKTRDAGATNGYVVRGKDHRGDERAAWNCEGATCAPHAATTWTAVGPAIVAKTRLGAAFRIFTVAEDGTETPLNDTGSVTDEELAAILRPGEGAAIEMLTGEMMGVRDPEGDGDHYDAYQEIAAPLVRRERALAAEVTTLRAEVERLARENAVLAHDAARAPRFVPFAGGEIS